MDYPVSDDVSPVDAQTPNLAKVSETYRFFPTREILRELENIGWTVNSVVTSRTKTENRPYAKHMVRLRHENFAAWTVNGLFPEMVVLNSHDGSSSFRLMAGIFRLVCRNGLIRKSLDMGDLAITHTRVFFAELITKVKLFQDYLIETMKIVPMWQQVVLPPELQLQFARGAYRIRYPDAAQDSSLDEAALRLNMPRRDADMSNDLWTTFNRVQENLLQGGQYSANNRRMRKVKGVSSLFDLNTRLWALAESYGG